MTNPYPGSAHWPVDYEGCTLHGTYVGLDGAPIQGTLVLSAAPEVLLDYSTPTIVVPRALTITLDVNGHFSVVVPATNDPDISPQLWTYTLVEQFVGGRSYSIEAPKGQVVDVTLVAPVPDSTGTPIVRGPKGDAGSVTSVQGVSPDVGGDVDLDGTVLLPVYNLTDVADVVAALNNLGGVHLTRTQTVTHKTLSLSTLIAPLITSGELVHGAAEFFDSVQLDATLTVALQAIFSGGLELAAGNLDLNDVGTIINQKPIVVTDWNNAVKPGFYQGVNAANQPVTFLTDMSIFVYAGYVMRGPTGQLTQVVFRAPTNVVGTGGTDPGHPEIWMRLLTAAGWQPWVCVYADSGWVTSSTYIAAASDVTVTSLRARRVANRVTLHVSYTLSPTVTITVPGDGNIGNHLVFTLLDMLKPAATAAAQALHSSYVGPLATHDIVSSGDVHLDAVPPGYSMAAGSHLTLSCGGMYLTD